MRTIAFSFLLLAPALPAPEAQAHYLWIDADDGYRLRFGEYEEAVHVRSPGRLDEIPGPRAWRGEAGLEQPVVPVRQLDGFALPAPVGGRRVLEEGVAVKDLSRAGTRTFRPVFRQP